MVWLQYFTLLLPSCVTQDFPDLLDPWLSCLLNREKVEKLVHTKGLINGNDCCVNETQLKELVQPSQHRAVWQFYNVVILNPLKDSLSETRIKTQ